MQQVGNFGELAVQHAVVGLRMKFRLHVGEHSVATLFRDLVDVGNHVRVIGEAGALCFGYQVEEAGASHIVKGTVHAFARPGCRTGQGRAVVQ